jgi:hypothetical protein
MSTLYVYSRRGCHLCDILVDEMLPLLQGRIDVEVRDIDTDEKWRRMYDVRIPVVEYEGRVICEYRLDKPKIQAIVAACEAPGGQ